MIGSILSDGVIQLRPIRPSDADAYLERQDAEMADRFEWPGPATRGLIDEAFERWNVAWRCGGHEKNFAIVETANGEMIGDCEIELRPDGFVNVMYVVFAPWRRQGYASRSVRLLVDHAADVFPGRSLLFRIHPDNAVSQRVARGAGAVRNGTETSGRGCALERWIAPATRRPAHQPDRR